MEPISLAEAKNFLKVDGADDNTLISALITAAREFVELSTLRAFVTQTWELTLDMAGGTVKVPRPPLQEVSKIETIDDVGVKTLISSTLYDVELGQASPGRVRIKTGCVWPIHRGFASFIVTFKAGYGDAAGSVPKALREAVLRVLGHFYEGRQGEELPAGVWALMRPYRVIYL